MISRNDIIRQYRMTADYHTHTVYSRVGPYLHGKGTVMQNAEVADMLGLRELAITDHGPHDIYGLNLKHIDNVRADIEEARARFPQMKILLGIEADLQDTENGLDVKPEERELFDIINAGYHVSLTKCHAARSIVSTKVGAPSGSMQRLRDLNTELALRAIYNNELFVLTHPGDKGPFAMDKLCRACEETGTLMEISSRHSHMTVDELIASKNYDVKYVISSDAHKPYQIGAYEQALLRAVDAGIDLNRIVNIERNSNLNEESDKR